MDIQKEIDDAVLKGLNELVIPLGVHFCNTTLPCGFSIIGLGNRIPYEEDR